MLKRWIARLATAAALLVAPVALGSPASASADSGKLGDDSPAAVAEQLRSAGFEPAEFQQGMRLLTTQQLKEFTGIDVVTPGDAMEESRKKRAVSSSLWGPCHADVRMDDLMRRRGEARVHGWWAKNDCESNKARVTVWLQQYWCDGRYGCTWITRDKGSRVIRPGTSTRTLAHKTCDSSVRTGWRAVADVDVVDEWDDADPRSQITNLYCRDY